MPPLGKYLLGFSIKLFKNPFYASFAFGVFSLTALYFTGKEFLKSKVLSIILVSLFFLDPLFFNQFWKSSIDIPQLFFLLLNISLFSMCVKTKKPFVVFLVGLSLGLFTETKTPIFTPFILFFELFFLIFTRRWKESGV